ncbi:C40 family peptidase [Nostoc ellipsosporum NOK]|jgi:cell wall-associated NlpC family hydrolase|nr:C40 family peptidase [Nostoc ellipsosporum NOK]
MVKQITYSALFALTLASCSTLQPAATASRKPSITEEKASSSGQVRFLDDISMDANASKPEAKPVYESHTRRASGGTASTRDNRSASSARLLSEKAPVVENTTAIQLKYAILMNTEVETLKDMHLLEYVDEWYGTRYRMGGNDKSGIDCSAFTKAIYLSAFGVTLPRTAREQYRAARIISSTELKEGDLLFFNTRGGVSHVGIYLGYNKFIHASTSQGVTVSDMFEPYYLKRFLGSGRIERPEAKAKTPGDEERLRGF